MYELTLKSDFPYKVGEKVIAVVIDDDFLPSKYEGIIRCIYFSPRTTECRIDDRKEVESDLSIDLYLGDSRSVILQYSKLKEKLDRGEKNIHWSSVNDYEKLLNEISQFYSKLFERRLKNQYGNK